MTKERRKYLEEKAELRRLKKSLQSLRATCLKYQFSSTLIHAREYSKPVIEFVLKETESN